MKTKGILGLIFMLVFTVSCQQGYTPKPTGYLKVEYPKKEYHLFTDARPYEFEYPVYATVIQFESGRKEPYWYNIQFPEYKGTLHLSYKKVNHNLKEYVEDSRTLVYKHASQADAINEIPYSDTSGRKYGIIYELKGNVASAYQFFLTDSAEHFLRGSLYFNTSPNRDSLNPIIGFVQEDIEHMIETIKWK